MPIKINDHLSAICQLQEEGIFTMTEQRATTQRVLSIVLRKFLQTS